MKKVLILAYDFPPYVSVGGLRPYNWFKYFKQYGIEPIVVTRQWEEKSTSNDYVKPSKLNKIEIEENEFGTIIRTPYFPNFPNRLLLKYGEKKFRLIRKVCSAYFEVTQYLWLAGPKKQLYLGADEFLKNNKVDAIIATGDPFILFHYASKLSRKHAIPWIADYRDPWSYDISLTKNSFLRKWNLFLEKKTLQNVSQITVVSKFLELDIETIIDSKPINIIENGYNPEVIESISNISQTSEQLSIALIGSTYKWHPIESFLKELSLFNSKHPKKEIILNLYGVNNSSEIIKLIIEKYTNLFHTTFVYEKLENKKLLKRLKQDNVMLLFNYYSFMGTKIFDYIAIKRQILFCYSNDKNAKELKSKFYTITEREEVSQKLQEELITQKKAGIIVENSSHLLNVLTELHREFQQTGQIECKSLDIEEYSRKEQTGKLAEIIKNSIN